MIVGSLRINTRSKHKAFTTILSCSIIAMEVWCFHVEGHFDPFWLGLGTLLVIVSYYSYRPLGRKNYRLVYLGIYLFAGSMTISALGLELPTPLAGVSIEGLLSIAMTLAFAFLSGFTVLREGRTPVQPKELTAALDEIKDFSDNKLQAVNDMVLLGCLAHDLETTGHILLPFLGKLRQDFRSYGKAYLASAMFFLENGKLPPDLSEKETKILASSGRGQLVLESYVSRVFAPATPLTKPGVWRALKHNGFLKKVLSVEEINKLRPRVLLSSIREVGSTVLAVTLMGSILVQNILPPGAGVPTGFFGKLAVNARVQLAEIKLRFAEVFHPYKDAAVLQEYADNIPKWLDERELLWKGNGGIVSVPKKQKNVHLRRLKLAHSIEASSGRGAGRGTAKLVGFLLSEHECEAVLNVLRQGGDKISFARELETKTALCFFKKGQPVEGIRLAQEELAAHPQSPWPVNALALMILASHPPAEVLGLLPSQRNTQELTLVRGLALTLAGRRDEGIPLLKECRDTYNSATSSGLSSFQPLFKIAMSLLAQHDGDFQQAAGLSFEALCDVLFAQEGVIIGPPAISAMMHTLNDSIERVRRKNSKDFRLLLWEAGLALALNQPKSCLELSSNYLSIPGLPQADIARKFIMLARRQIKR